MLTILLFFIIFYITMTWAKWIPKVHKAYHNLWSYLSPHDLMGISIHTFCKKVPPPPPAPFHLIWCNCGLLPKAVIPLFTITVLSHPLLCARSGNHTAAGYVVSVCWFNKIYFFPLFVVQSSTQSVNAKATQSSDQYQQKEREDFFWLQSTFTPDYM